LHEIKVFLDGNCAVTDYKALDESSQAQDIAFLAKVQKNTLNPRAVSEIRG